MGNKLILVICLPCRVGDSELYNWPFALPCLAGRQESGNKCPTILEMCCLHQQWRSERYRESSEFICSYECRSLLFFFLILLFLACSWGVGGGWVGCGGLQ